MMKPLNRRLLIEVVKEEPRTGSFFVPQEEKPQDFIVATVVSCADNCAEDLSGRRVVVHAFGIEKVTVDGSEYTFIGENHLVCVTEK